MSELTLNGIKTPTLESNEVALILDSLAVQPYNRVAPLIAKIVEQVRDESPRDASTG